MVALSQLRMPNSLEEPCVIIDAKQFSMQDLKSKHCGLCEGGVEPFDTEKIKSYMPALCLQWDVIDPAKGGTGGKKIAHQFKFKNFPEAIAFVNKIVPIAEAEGHHPDLHIYYNKVTVELWTHAIGGLSENDFIMAAKVENLF